MWPLTNDLLTEEATWMNNETFRPNKKDAFT